MKRGEIYFADLNPTQDSEINKKRPVLIVSNNANNKMASTVTVIPITSNVNKTYPFEVLLDKNTGLSKISKAQCQQIRTISKLRITDCLPISKINEETMKNVENSIKLHLSLT